MSKSRNGTTETIESTDESIDQATESAVDTLLEVSAIVDDALAGASADAPVADVITEAIEAEDEQRPSRRRRIAKGGTIVLVTAAVAVAAGVALAMVLRRRDAGEDLEEDLFA
jgi:phytoene/squalene synthetase